MSAEEDVWKSIVGAVVLVIGVPFLVFVYCPAQERARREWRNFRDTHACHIVGHMDANGRSEKMTGWLCNDGQTYWKRASDDQEASK